MKKADRMEEFIEQISTETSRWPTAYVGYFICFNRGDFYEAHDVLEHLWLQTVGPEAAYYKGLIQVAGAFVHLRKHYLRPLHHKDGRRLAPAARLLRLAMGAFTFLPSPHLGVDLANLLSLCSQIATSIESSSFTRNPWRPESSPQILLADARVQFFKGDTGPS